MLSVLKRKYCQNRFLFLFTIAAVTAVLGILIWKLLCGRYYHAFYCLLAIFIFFIPMFGEKLLRISIPAGLKLIILLFAIAANICGEIFGFYIRLPFWDSVLHIIWGFAAGAVGCGFLQMLNPNGKHDNTRRYAFFSALFCLCFSIATGVLWEFCEFFMDSVFLLDMQKDAYVGAVSSVLLNPQGENSAVKVIIESLVVNGRTWKGYIDIGLTDTMKDLYVNSGGALLFAVCAAFCPRDKKLWRLLELLIPATSR